MYRLLLQIGEHVVQVDCYSNQLVKMFKKGYFFAKNQIGVQPDLCIRIEDGYGVPFVDYDVRITEQSSSIIYQRADYKIEVDSQFKNAKMFVHDGLALKHALTNLYSSFILHHNWGLLVHSSCAIERGEAHIFAGHSGAGKSTAARLSHPRDLLSDEATLIKITPNQVTVFNSPFRSELETSDSTVKADLKSIQILYQALQNKRIKLTRADALLYLMDKVFFWPHSHQETKNILKLLTLLVKQVPVYELHFQKNNTFWELIS